MRAAWKKFQRWVADRVRSPWALLLFPLCALLILGFFPARLLWGVLPLGTGPLPENLFVALSQSDSARQQFELWLKVAGGFVVLIGFWQLAQSRRQFAWERVEKACALLLEQGPDGSPSDAHREIGLVLLQEAFEKQREARSLIIRIIRRYVQQQTRIRPVAMREGQQGALAEEDCPAGVHPLSRTMEVFFRASSNHRRVLRRRSSTSSCRGWNCDIPISKECRLTGATCGDLDLLVRRPIRHKHEACSGFPCGTVFWQGRSLKIWRLMDATSAAVNLTKLGFAT